ncbi:MAG: tetratricopeptide (TPR) repeat protein [Verrucomicrobiales bacterium]|jgi:tetratricopeptide (TPR) repeat protein
MLSVRPYRIIRRAAVCFSAIVAITVSILSAAPEPSPELLKSAGYSNAIAALDSHLYDVAAQRLKKLLDSTEASDFTTPDKQWLTEQMAMAHVRADQPSAALDALDGLSASSTSQFWRAQALVQLGRFTLAERLLKELIDNSHPEKDTCHFTRARILGELDRLPEAVDELKEAMMSNDEMVSARARVALAESFFKLGRNDEIAQVFDSAIPQPYQSQLRYIMGLVLLQEPNHQKAIRAFKDVLTLREKLPDELVTSCEIGLATALAGSDQTDAAAQQLMTTIERLTEGPLLLEAFASLEALNLLTTPTVTARLEQWSNDSAAERATIARFYSIVVEESGNEANAALALYAAFTVENPDHPLIPQALLRRAVLLAQSSRQDGQSEALRALKKLQSFSIPIASEEWIRFLTAKAEFVIASAAGDTSSNNTPAEIAAAAERFRNAEAAFLEAAKSADPRTAAAAAYDAAIAALRADARKSIAPYLSSLEENPEIKGDLLIERGLYLAANKHFRDAQQALENFISFSPNHPRAFAGHLAVAEIAMIELEPKIRTSLKHLESAGRQPGLSDLQKQQLDYTRFWLEESQRGEEPSKMIAQGMQFLKNWPESPWRDDIQMKLGEHYFRTENYPLALTMFEDLERESPDSELAEAALYFAGKANIRLDPADGTERAIAIWNRVVKNGGQLSIAARYQQALAKRRQLKHDEAAEILRSLLENDNVSSEERKAMMCSLGETLFSQSRDVPAKLKEAEDVFRELVVLSENSPSWRNQALYRQAKCHESVGDLQSAKNSYFSVFDTKVQDLPDYVWYYRAGFQLFELLKEEKNWEAAIEVGTKLADSESPTKGPRAIEAENKVEALKLAQFLR